MKFFAFLLALFLCLAVPASGAEDEGPIFEEKPGILEFSGQMMARPLQANALAKQGLSLAEIDARRAISAERLASTLVHYEPLTDTHIFRIPEGEDENSLYKSLTATGDYEYVHPDWVCFPIATPNDPNFSSQWHHQNMDSELAWNINTGNISYVAAVCDTGVDKDHPDLQAHLVSGYNAVDRIPESQGGDVNDINGHGTNCAGCVAAIGNNGIGVAGMNWTLSVMPIRVTNSSGGGANMSDLTHGALWSAQNGAQSMSVSYTGVETPSVGTTGTQIKALGALLCWAADNYGQNHSSFDWDDVIVVGATNPSDERTSWSSYGVAVDVMAPGENIMTTANGGGYAAVSGTSFSTPLTNGAVALIWTAAPGLSADDVEQKLFDGCEDMYPQNWGTHGRVNVYESLKLLSLTLSFPNGIPSGKRPPGLSETITMGIIPGGENYVPGTGFMYYRYDSGSSFTAVPVTSLGGDLYEVELPATVPGDEPEFYFVAEGDGGSTVYSPPGAPGNVHSYDVCLVEEILYDDFENDTGWTVVNTNVDTGAWVRAVPSGSGDRGDPPTDSDGSGKCYITGNGSDEDLDGGPTVLTSPTFDLSSGDAQITYDRWQYNDDGDDFLTVEISNNNGTTWTQVESVTDDSGGWITKTIDVSTYVTPTSQMKLRYTSSDQPNDSVTESGLDAFGVQRINYFPELYANAYDLSAATGSDIDFMLDAGAAYAGRDYLILASLSGSAPGMDINGVHVPLNWDWVSDYIYNNLGMSVFQDFFSQLDGAGQASATLNLNAAPGLVPFVGQDLTFAFAVTGPVDFASNPLYVAIQP